MSGRPEPPVGLEGWRFDSAGPEAIRSDVLQTFPFEYAREYARECTREYPRADGSEDLRQPGGAGRELLLELRTDEFTSVCPWSGLPDFGRLRVVYVPQARCLELKSFKFYLFSYRHVGIYYEHLVPRILEDLVTACDPNYLRVEGDFNDRGGIASRAHAEFRRPGWVPSGPLELSPAARG